MFCSYASRYYSAYRSGDIAVLVIFFLAMTRYITNPTSATTNTPTSSAVMAIPATVPPGRPPEPAGWGNLGTSTVGSVEQQLQMKYMYKVPKYGKTCQFSGNVNSIVNPILCAILTYPTSIYYRTYIQ